MTDEQEDAHLEPLAKAMDMMIYKLGLVRVETPTEITMNQEKKDRIAGRDERLAAAQLTGEYRDQFCFEPEKPPDPLPSFLDALNQKRANRGQKPI